MQLIILHDNNSGHFENVHQKKETDIYTDNIYDFYCSKCRLWFDTKHSSDLRFEVKNMSGNMIPIGLVMCVLTSAINIGKFSGKLNCHWEPFWKMAAILNISVADGFLKASPGNVWRLGSCNRCSSVWLQDVCRRQKHHAVGLTLCYLLH